MMVIIYVYTQCEPFQKMLSPLLTNFIVIRTLGAELEKLQ